MGPKKKGLRVGGGAAKVLWRSGDGEEEMISVVLLQREHNTHESFPKL